MRKFLKNFNWLPYFIFLPLSMMKYTVFALILEFIINGAEKNIFISARSLYLPMLVILISFCIIVVSQFIIKYNKTVIIQNALKSIRKKIVEKLLSKDENKTLENQAEYLSLIFNDLKLIENDYYPNIFIIIEQVIALLIAIYMIFTRSWKLGLLLTIGLFIPSIFPRLFKKKTHRASEIWSKSNQIFTKQIQETLKGIITIKSYNNEMIREKHINNSLSDLYKDAAWLIIIKEICNSIVLGTGLIITSICFLYGAFLVSKGEITIGGMMAVIQMSNAIYEPITSITNCRNTIYSTKPIREKIEKELNEKESPRKHVNTVNFENIITLDNIEYKAENQKILDHVSFSIKKGEKILIIGPNGSGKSTLFKIIQGRIKSYDGNIIIDGKLIEDKGSNLLYSSIGLIQQNVFLFDDTLENNITLNESFDPADIQESITFCELNDVLNDKRNELLGENGSRLSGGQKQRVEIARAWIRKRDILLMDEAFSAIDKQSRNRIESKILNEKDLTVLSIEHTVDKSNIYLYDHIIVLKEGRIVELDSPSNCEKNKNSFIQNILLNSSTDN